MMKTCTKCGQAKPLIEFYKDKKGKDGTCCRCKTCVKAAKVMYRAKNPEKVRAKKAEWRAENLEKERARNAKWYAENHEKARATAAKWRAENPEKVNVASARYRAKNPEKARAKNAEWSAKNPDKVRVYSSRRRAAKLQRTPPWADHEKVNAVYAEQQRYLDLGIDCHVDHIVPLQGRTASGLHTHDNLKIVLAEDNASKHNKVPDDPYSITPTWYELRKRAA